MTILMVILCFFLEINNNQNFKLGPNSMAKHTYKIESEFDIDYALKL